MVGRVKHVVVRAAQRADNRWTFLVAVIWLGIVVAQMVSSSEGQLMPASARCYPYDQAETQRLEELSKDGTYLAAD